MRNLITCGAFAIFLLASCQRELHFPTTPDAITIPEKVITAIVIYNPLVGDYDSIAFQYTPNLIKQSHFDRNGNTETRSFSYDAAGRLTQVDDDKAIYYTNNDRATRIHFDYNGAGQLQRTTTDFTRVSGVMAEFKNDEAANIKMVTVYDTAYRTPAYNLDWVNRIIYTRVNARNYILYDSSILSNTSYAGLVTTVVSEFAYDADTIVSTINKRVYSNSQLTESGTMNAARDKPAPVYTALRKKLFRNLANWFDAGEIWQDTRYDLFPLPGGPYKSTLYNGLFTGTGQSFVRNYQFENVYSNGDLDNSMVTYTLTGQGTSNYVTWLKFYYDYQ